MSPRAQPHLPSGKYAANAAWSALAVIAFNLARTTPSPRGMATARWVSARSRMVNTQSQDHLDGTPAGAASADTSALGTEMGSIVEEAGFLTIELATAQPECQSREFGAGSRIRYTHSFPEWPDRKVRRSLLSNAGGSVLRCAA